MHLFSDRSQMMSKCGMNKKVSHEAQPSVSLMFLPHFDVLCDLLLNRRTATWNLFVLYNKNALKFLFQISPLWWTRKKHWHDLTVRLYRMKLTDSLLCLAKNNSLNLQILNFEFEPITIIVIGSNSKFKKFKKTWIECCRHRCVCPLIDHRREPIRIRE